MKVENVIKKIPGYDPHQHKGKCYFDVKAAEKAVEFFKECLTHTKGRFARKPFDLRNWQTAIVANLFGWKMNDTNLRRYREAFIYVPKKNGKTELAAGMALTSFFRDGELGGEIYAAAAKKDQAKLVWTAGKTMIQQNKTLNNSCKIYQSSIHFPSINASFKPIASDANTEDGGSTHFAVIDELHRFKNRDLVDLLENSTGAREQPLLVYITTADYDRVSICNEKLEYAKKVRDGIIEDIHLLPVLYMAERDDDWTDQEVWKKANPNLGISISYDEFKRAFQKAMDNPSQQNAFKRLRLNMTTEQDVRWLDMADWDKCGEEFNPDDLEGQECFAGLDLASNKDITALVLYFPETHHLLPYCFIPGDNAVKRERDDRVPYKQWATDGYMIMTEGDACDYDFIRKKVNDLNEKFNIKEIAIDRWNASQLINQLTGDGFDVVPFGQGFASMSAPTKEFERLIIEGSLNHGKHPVLRWCASNIVVRTDEADNIKPNKEKSSERIDPIVAAIMAIGRAIAQGIESESVYDTRGIISI